MCKYDCLSFLATCYSQSDDSYPSDSSSCTSFHKCLTPMVQASKRSVKTSWQTIFKSSNRTWIKQKVSTTYYLLTECNVQCKTISFYCNSNYHNCHQIACYKAMEGLCLALPCRQLLDTKFFEESTGCKANVFTLHSLDTWRNVALNSLWYYVTCVK